MMLAGLAGKPAMRQRLDIQGLRAVAVLAVLLFHATPYLPGGFLGVDVFFVISGYVIAGMALGDGHHTPNDRFAAWAFLRRRLLRILPPMAIVVTTAVLAGIFIDTPDRMAEGLPKTALAALLGVANIHFYLEASDYFVTYQLSPLLHLWSLSVEMQFYLLATLLFAALFAFARHPAKIRVALLYVTVSILLGSFVCALTVSHKFGWPSPTRPREFLFFMLPVRLWEFGLGILALLLNRRASQLTAHQVNSAQVSALIALGASFLLMRPALHPAPYHALPAALGTMVLLATGPGGWVAQLLACRPLVGLGDRSYSIYLWQGVLIVYAARLYPTPTATALAALAAILLAFLLYSVIELPFRKPNLAAAVPRTGTSPHLLGLKVFGIAVAALVSSWVLVTHVLSPQMAEKPARATTLDASCQRQRGVLGIAPCAYGPAEQPPVLLIGDSHAGALSQAVVDAAAQTQRRAIVTTASACAVPEYKENVAYRSSCEGYTQLAIDHARDVRASVVILHQFSEFYMEELAISPDRWEASLTLALQQLRATGARVLVVGDTPRLRMAPGKPLFASSWTADLSESLRIRQRIAIIEQRAAAKAGADYLSAAEMLCEGNLCPVFENDGWVYTDTDHLSYRGAARLVAPIVRYLEK